MNTQQRLHHNVELWSHVQPKDALFVPYQSPAAIGRCATRLGEDNLFKEVDGNRHYFHATNGAAAQAQRLVDTLSLQGKQVLYVFGVGMGHLYDALLPWLRQHRRHSVVFLENDLAVLRFFFETARATHLLKDPQAELYYFPTLHQGGDIFEQLYWNHILTQMEFTALPLYKKLAGPLYEELRHTIVYDAAVKNALVEEYLRYGANFFKNYYANMLHLDSSFLGNKMFGQFHNVPAILCGAGPSLSDVLPQLASLQERALVFGGGSAMNALTNAHVVPHFGCGVDPNPLQLKRLSTSSAFEVPFFYRNRVLHQAFRKMHGPRLYITGSGGYDLADWFEEQLDIKSEWFDEGHNVINLCLQIAYRMGCNPIFFVGMDLGFTGMRSYAGGIEQNVRIRKKDLFGSGDFDKDALLRHDIHGRPFYTLWKWIAEADWIGRFAQEHPDVELINCTGAGLGFPGVPNMELGEALDKYCTAQYDLRNRVHASIQQCRMPHVTEQLMADLTNRWRDSLVRCVDNFSLMIDETKKMQQRIRVDKKVPAITQSGLAALAETEIAEEPAYEYLLDLFNNIYSRILNSEVRTLRLSRLSNMRRTLKKMDLNVRRMAFLRDVARVNIGIIDVAFRARQLGDMPDEEEAKDVFSRYQQQFEAALKDKK